MQVKARSEEQLSWAIVIITVIHTYSCEIGAIESIPDFMPKA